MKKFKKIIACVMVIATLGSSMILPTTVNAVNNDAEVVTYFDGSYYYDDDYYKNNSVTGKTGIICIDYTSSYYSSVDDTSIIYDSFINSLNDETCYRIASLSEYYYYDDNSSDGIVKVDSLDVSKIDNLVVYNSSSLDDTKLDEFLNKLGIDKSKCNNFLRKMPYLYDNTNNEYKYYYLSGHAFLIGAYLPNKISKNTDDIITYLSETYKNYTDYYLEQSGILDNPIFSAMIKEDDNFTSGDDFLYYADGHGLASFSSGINCTLFFESDNPNLTIDDVLTKEQQDELYFLEDENSKDYCVNIELRNSGVSEITGLTRYSMYLPKIKKDLSTNEFFEYKYKIGQSLLDSGIAKYSYFMAHASYDDYNNIGIESGDIVITMNDGSTPTTELFGEYANSVQSIEKIDCQEGTIINDEKSYYKVTLTNYNDISKIILYLQDNPNVKNASCIDYDYISTCLASYGHSMSYEIPIHSSMNSIGSSNIYAEPTNIRGDVNYDGKVNVIDVMTLRRYLLHLLEW